MGEEDRFLSFVESARGMLFESLQLEFEEDPEGEKPALTLSSWSWACTIILECCKAYPTGVTSAILLSELYESWLRKERSHRSRRSKVLAESDLANGEAFKLRKQNQILSTKITSIDLMLEKRSISLEEVLDTIIIDIKLLPDTTIYVLTLGDAWSTNTVEMYLHSKFNGLIDGTNGIIRKSREIRLTGCRLRISPSWVPLPNRLLPTEYATILLDEGQDVDAMFLGAKFCNDYFSSINLSGIKDGMDYYFYAKVEEIEVGDPQAKDKQCRITLRDDNGDTLLFILWNEQICLGNLLSRGSMLAIERPSVSYQLESDDRTISQLWFEYTLQTRLYNVPFLPLADQVARVESRLMHNTRLHLIQLAMDQLQLEKAGNLPVQIDIPTNSEGALDFRHFPVRILVEHVQANMSNVALYGLVTHLSPAPAMKSIMKHNLESYKSVFMFRIGDSTGVLDIKLYFKDNWSAGQVHVGQMVFISGLVTSKGSNGRMQCFWKEKDEGVSLVNMTQLRAVLTSSCLHRCVPLSAISSSSLSVQVCRVRIGPFVQNGVQVNNCHKLCGHPVTGQQLGDLPVWRCNFCHRSVEANEISLAFFMTTLLLDTYPGHKTRVYATCSGQAALTIMQAAPADFCTWPEIDQAMYVYSLENEEFLVTLYSGLQDDMGSFQTIGQSIDISSVTCLRIGQAARPNPNQ